MYFRYDSKNELFGINVNGTEYMYVKNLQGDVTGIADMSGNIVVQYRYDPWGQVESVTGSLASTLGQLNPMRYRGYYLDVETGYYYLQSRYYEPEMRRFINADDILLAKLTDNNLFSYCQNNPINNTDENGALSVKSIVNFVFSLGWKAWKIIQKVWSAFVKPGKINLKPFEIVIDVVIGILVPSIATALKLLTYKAVTKKLVSIVFRKTGQGLMYVLTKFGINVGLNVMISKLLDYTVKNSHRFFTAGGIICFILDKLDGSTDYWFTYQKRYR